MLFSLCVCDSRGPFCNTDEPHGTIECKRVMEWDVKLCKRIIKKMWCMLLQIMIYTLFTAKCT